MGLNATRTDSDLQSADRAHWQRQFVASMELLKTRMGMLRDQTDWSELELTMTQMRVLGLLFCQTHRMSEIAAAVGSSVQAATSLIDRLVDRGLVAREHDTIDRRVVICRLTPAGKDEVQRFYRIGQARMELLVDVLADDELERVANAMAILADAALRLQQMEASAASARPEAEAVLA